MENLNNGKEKDAVKKISYVVNKHLGILFLISFLVILIFAYICNKNYANRITNNKNSNSTSSYSTNYNSSKYSSSKSKYSEAEIITITKYYVKSKLKSPSTAKFCPQNKISITELSDGILVTGYVDAENGFGATVRTNFKVTLTKDGSSIKNIYMN